ncbi:MAG: ribokinase [Candidatus Rokubacteria bacterium]|nr:ribokinase [Candidatus Rokubacteria bacterium]
MRPRASGEPPDFVAVGHLTVDETPRGLRPGGSVLYAGLLAHHLGLRVGLVTSHGPDFPREVVPPEIEVVAVPAPATTRFALRYAPAGRTLTLRARATALAPFHLPAHFAETGLAYLAPVADEVSPDFAAAFPQAAVGVGAQGWCRRWDREGRVSMRPWPDPEAVLARAQGLFLSSDDVAGWEDEALELYQHVPLGALTLAARGAILFVNGERSGVEAAPAVEVEPTGAGDGFAAAFLIRYNAGGDPYEAASFAAVAGAITVEADGIAGVPSRAELESRWRAFQLR